MYLDDQICEDQKSSKEFKDEYFQLKKCVDNLELKSLFTNVEDEGGCFVTINAGSGGMDAFEWAEMLFKMYFSWVKSKKWKFSITSISKAAMGLHSVTFQVRGSYAYGFFRSEEGIHKLIRMSPYDKKARRHTCFASISVVPTADTYSRVEIGKVKVETFRSSGAGGQHANTTDSAVRVTHLETGLVVTCEQERSQLQNKKMCFELLKAKLAQRTEKLRQQEKKSKYKDQVKNTWGSGPIRSYVLDPYNLVKDMRSGLEIGNVASVLNGDLLDELVFSYLRK